MRVRLNSGRKRDWVADYDSANEVFKAMQEEAAFGIWVEARPEDDRTDIVARLYHEVNESAVTLALDLWFEAERAAREAEKKADT